MRIYVIAICLIAICILSAGGVGAQAPARREQLVYSLTAFDGASFSKSFCPPSEDTLYFIADNSSVIDARKTFIYFWPITRRYMAGFRSLDEKLPGTIEILKGGEVIQTLQRQTYTLFYPEGYWSDKATLYSDQEAERRFAEYQSAVEAFNRKLRDYYEEMRIYREEFNRFLEEIRIRRESGEEGITNIEMPQEPSPPDFVDFYASEPAQGFILNLPVGNYQIRLRCPDGRIYEGSEKNVVVFESRRTGGVGYEIIPGNRWTRRESVDDPSWIIHGAGHNVLYFNPYHQAEYNELYHNKLEDPQNSGRIERWKWVHIDPIDDVHMVLSRGEEILQQIERAPYFVKQIPGPELGYEIIPYDDELLQRGYQPTFESYQIELSTNLPPEEYTVSALQDGSAEHLPESERSIRLLRKENANYLYPIAFFPLVFGIVVILSRWTRIDR